MKNFNKKVSLALLVSLVVALFVPIMGFANETNVDLGTADSFAILAGSAITNTGTTTISGSAIQIGLHPGPDSAITGLGVLATNVVTYAEAGAAKVDLLAAYNDAAGKSVTQTIGSDLAGQTLTPGVYNSADGTFENSGTLTLDSDDPNGVFVFQTATTLITATDSEIVLTNEARADKVFWQVGSSATLGIRSKFVGSILADTSITATTDAEIQGRLLAIEGAVTLDSNTIINNLYRSITVEKEVTGNMADGDYEFTFEIYEGVNLVDTVTASGNTDGLSIPLEPGTYTVTEIDPSPYTLATDNNLEITLIDGNETAQFTNDYTRSTSSSTTTGTYTMTIDKEAEENEVEVGDLANFIITVSNTGNRTLSDIEVVDDMTGLDETITLTPGESETFNVSVTTEEVGTLTNTAEANHDIAPSVEDSDSVRVISTPEVTQGTYELSITKTANVVGTETIKFGDTVEFTIVVTNTGNETLTNVLVKDEQATFETTIDTLEPGESKEFLVQAIMPNTPGPYTNTAMASSSTAGVNLSNDTVFVEELGELDIPETSANPSNLLYGFGALVSGVGIYLSKKKR